MLTCTCTMASGRPWCMVNTDHRPSRSVTILIGGTIDHRPCTHSEHCMGWARLDHPERPAQPAADHPDLGAMYRSASETASGQLDAADTPAR